MKNLLLIPIFFVFSFHSPAQTLNDKGLYVSADGELYSGKVQKTIKDRRSEFTVQKGVLNGPVTYFFPDGKIMEQGEFKEGLKDNKWTRYFESGAVSAIAFYSAGKKSGTWLVFDENGQKRFEMFYNEGEKTGTWSSWDDTGALISTKDYSKTF